MYFMFYFDLNVLTLGYITRYFSYAGWEKSQAWSLAGTKWWPEYDKPLGSPIDPPMMTIDGNDYKFSRRFSSGTKVDLDLQNHSASIMWATTSSSE